MVPEEAGAYAITASVVAQSPVNECADQCPAVCRQTWRRHDGNLTPPDSLADACREMYKREVQITRSPDAQIREIC